MPITQDVGAMTLEETIELFKRLMENIPDDELAAILTDSLDDDMREGLAAEWTPDAENA